MLRGSFTLFIAMVVWSSAISQTDTDTYLTDHPADDRFGSFSPDGERIVFETNRDGNWEIYIMQSDGTSPSRITAHDSADRSPVWHPLENKIIYESRRSGRTELFEYDFLSGKETQITQEGCAGDLMFPAYAPDGMYIAFSCRMSDSISCIMVANVETRQCDTIVHAPFRSFYPRWSPDGNQLLYFSRKETDNEIDEVYLYTMASRSEMKVASAETHSFCPVFAHSGNRFAFVRSMPDIRPEIYLSTLDGSHTWRVTHNQTGDTLPSWSPDDRFLLISSFRNGNYDVALVPVNAE